MMYRPRSTASVHLRDGVECVTDRTCCGSGCRIGVVTLLYAQSPRSAASGRPMAPTISASQTGIRFLVTFSSPDDESVPAGLAAGGATPPTDVRVKTGSLP